MVMGSQSAGGDLHLLSSLDNNCDYWKQAMQIRCNECAAQREGTMRHQHPWYSFKLFVSVWHDTVEHRSCALHLQSSAEVLPCELTRVSRALGPSLKDKPWKAQTHSTAEALIPSDVSTRGWLAARHLLTAKEGTVNVTCVTGSPSLPKTECDATPQRWCASGLCTDLHHHCHVASSQSPGSEWSGTSKQCTKSLLKLQTLWEAFATCPRSESVSLSH